MVFEYSSVESQLLRSLDSSTVNVRSACGQRNGDIVCSSHGETLIRVAKLRATSGVCSGCSEPPKSSDSDRESIGGLLYSFKLT